MLMEERQSAVLNYLCLMFFALLQKEDKVISERSSDSASPKASGNSSTRFTHTFIEISVCVCGCCGVTSVFICLLDNCSTETRTLPAVRVPVKGTAPPPMSREKTANQAAESWLEEARKEAGISKPFRVSQ